MFLFQRIYKIPWKEIIERKSMSIYKNLVYKGCGWYEEYRVADKDELKNANDIWKKIIDI